MFLKFTTIEFFCFQKSVVCFLLVIAPVFVGSTVDDVVHNVFCFCFNVCNYRNAQSHACFAIRKVASLFCPESINKCIVYCLLEACSINILNVLYVTILGTSTSPFLNLSIPRITDRYLTLVVWLSLVYLFFKPGRLLWIVAPRPMLFSDCANQEYI